MRGVKTGQIFNMGYWRLGFACLQVGSLIKLMAEMQMGLVNLINVSLACEDGNSKLVEVYSATYSIQFLKVMKSFSRLESHS